MTIVRHPLWLLIAGFTVWSIAFVALYAIQALGCHLGWSGDLHRATLIAVFALAILVHAGIVWLSRAAPAPTPTHGFVRQAGLWASIAAIASAILTFAPVLFASTCV